MTRTTLDTAVLHMAQDLLGLPRETSADKTFRTLCSVVSERKDLAQQEAVRSWLEKQINTIKENP